MTTAHHTNVPAGNTNPKGVSPMARNSYSVRCPQIVCAGCGGQTVEARDMGTTVQVAACESLKAQGWTGPALVLWTSQALELLTPASYEAPLQHRDGLVVFA